MGVLGGSRHCAQPRCSATVGLRPRITAALWSHSARRDTDAAVPAACSLQPPAAPQAAAVLTLHSNLTLQPSLRCTVTSCCSHVGIAWEPYAAAVLALRRDLVLQPPWRGMNIGSVCSKVPGGSQHRVPSPPPPAVVWMLCPGALRCRGWRVGHTVAIPAVSPSRSAPTVLGGPGAGSTRGTVRSMGCSECGVRRAVWGCPARSGGAQRPPCPPTPPVLAVQLCGS